MIADDSPRLPDATPSTPERPFPFGIGLRYLTSTASPNASAAFARQVRLVSDVLLHVGEKPAIRDRSAARRAASAPQTPWTHIPASAHDARVKFFRSAEEKQQNAEAEAAFREVVAELSTSDPESTLQLAKRVEGDSRFAGLSARDRRKLGEQAFLQYADNALADDHLTDDEERALTALAEAVGFEQSDFQQHDLYTRLQVAKLNDGRLPTVDAPRLMAKRNEVVYLETSAALMKEVAVREWRGASQGFSFRVAKGVRYRVGTTRGHLVNVGTQLQIADTGVLSITNQRAAFLGQRKTVDMPYSKLLGMNMFSDAISFSL